MPAARGSSSPALRPNKKDLGKLGLFYLAVAGGLVASHLSNRIRRLPMKLIVNSKLHN